MTIIIIAAAPAPTFVACCGCRLVESACVCIEAEGVEVCQECDGAPCRCDDEWCVGCDGWASECNPLDHFECHFCEDHGVVLHGDRERPCQNCQGVGSWREWDREMAAEARFEMERDGCW